MIDWRAAFGRGVGRRRVGRVAMPIALPCSGHRHLEGGPGGKAADLCVFRREDAARLTVVFDVGVLAYRSDFIGAVVPPILAVENLSSVSGDGLGYPITSL